MLEGGFNNGPILLFIFLAIKMAGYCLAAIVLARLFQKPQMQGFKNVIIFGFTRLLVGIAVVLATTALTNYYHIENARNVYIGIYPVRIIEWFLFIWLFFDYKLEKPMRIFVYALIAGLYSYLLDIPAIASAVLLAKY